ncbi:MAG: porin [Planctomycetaceae bacterium]|nr:porin [Planctomycetaceae bacterium]
MRTTIHFLVTVIALSLGASGALAQNYPSAAYAPTASYYAADAGDLESRITALEADMKKKEDKVDTKKKFSAEWSGRIFTDLVNFGDPHVKAGDFTGPGDFGPGDFIGLRDARIGVTGKGFEVFDYKVEIGFNQNNSVQITDVFMGVQKVPGLDYVRLGHYKVESGLSYLTSSRNSTAMERTTAVSTFSPGRRFGAGQTYLFANDRIRWFNGIFLAGDRASGNKFHVDGDIDDKGAIYNSRLSLVPYYAKDGERYLHLGGHYMYRENDQKSIPPMYSSGNTRIGGFSRAGAAWFTTSAVASHYNQGGLEMAWGRGPLAISSELFAGSFGKGRDMYGGYIEARYFLTGDCRPYSKSGGTMGNVKLKKNFLTGEEIYRTHHHGAAKGFAIKSLGAWEVFAQWSFVDSDRVAFSAPNARGGRAVDTVLGVNWYWNPNTRMIFEYVHSDGTRQTHTGTAGTTTYYCRATEDIFATSFRFYF